MLDRRCLTTPAACSREGVDLQIYYRKRRDCFRTVVRAKGTRKKKERLGAEKLQPPLRARWHNAQALAVGGPVLPTARLKATARASAPSESATHVRAG